MGLSKSTRICILLAIDTAFFILELTVGYAVHSLALVADAFHMLNDVLSLCVGLWAVKVAQQKTSSKMYTYGWQRAETLGALINGVFLVALCLSIFLEAIQRFVEPQVVSNPKLVLIVGCLGLASNIIGLFLFHDHGHSHGGGGHSHGHAHTDPVRHAEQGQSHPADITAADESGNVADILPENRIASWPTSQQSRADSNDTSVTLVADKSKSTGAQSKSTKQRRDRSHSRTFSSVDDVPVMPSSFRRSIISASKLDAIDSDGDDHGISSSATPNTTKHADATDSLLAGRGGDHYGAVSESHDHASHKHAQPKSADGHGHSHGDLNMRGVFLHVMGDALGNIGVIVAALLIWLTDFSWRYYFDPGVSLVITIIILLSAIPLCKAASRILLQAVPAGLSVDDIKQDIEALHGIVSCHHLHVWQLSDTKLVASLHIQVAFDFEGEGSARYMKLARAVRDCLHQYGIHSSTIQPEFCLDPHHDHATPPDGHGNVDGPADGLLPGSRNRSVSGGANEADPCLLECADSCGNDQSCCPGPESSAANSHKDHDDHDGHSH